jgi:hypothetical protein
MIDPREWLRVPEPDEVAMAARALAALRSFDVVTAVRFRLADERIELPPLLLQLFAQVLEVVAGGNPVIVAPAPTELTAPEAAQVLDVSSEQMSTLLEEGRIPYRCVDGRQVIRLADPVAFSRRDHEVRRHAADAMTREAQALGLDY